MSTGYYVSIGSYTTSITVNGENKSEVKIKYSKKVAGNYEHDIIWRLGNSEKRLYLDIPSDTFTYKTFSFQIPVEWLCEIPSNSVGTGQIILETVDMNTAKTVYQETKNFTVYVPESFKPTISTFNFFLNDKNNIDVDYAVYGFSDANINAYISPHSTSPIKSYRITGGGINFSDTCSLNNDTEINFYTTTPIITALGNTALTLTVEDERGRTASITTEQFYVQPYNRPLIKGISAYRTDSEGITQSDGEYIKLTVEAAICSIKNGNEEELNSMTCFLKWRKVNGDYGALTEISNNTPYIFEAEKDFSYEIRCEVRDRYLITEAYCNVSGVSSDINVSDGGGGVAVGTKAVKGYFDVAYESRFQKGIGSEKEISSNTGLISNGTKSRGDFLSFGEAEPIEAYVTSGGSYYGDDFNKYTAIGVYGVFSEGVIAPYPAYGAKILNIPCEQPGTLRVYNATGADDDTATEKYIMQEYVVFDGSGTYRRGLSKIRVSSEVEWPSEWTIPEDWYYYPAVKAQFSDHPIESGTSGIWTYCKRNNGIAECWGTYKITVKSTDWSIWAGAEKIYTTDNNAIELSFPEGLFNEPPTLIPQLNNFGTGCWLGVKGGGSNTTENSTGSFILMRPNAAGSDINCTISFIAKGTWK